MSKIIVVNGKQYYAETGLLVENQPTTAEAEATSGRIHNGVQKSQTLNRRFVKQPARQTEAQIEAIRQFRRKHDYEEARKRAAQMNAAAARKRAASTPQISHFNKGVGGAKRIISPIAQPTEAPIAPAQIHPLQTKINAESQIHAEKHLPSAKEIKESAISQAIANTNASPKTRKKSRGVKKPVFWRSKNFVGLTASFTVIVACLGYLSYLNLPNVSTRIAAMQAGINADLPAYTPSNYQLNGLAKFDGRAVNISYKSDENEYTIKQSSSNWDSVALLNNYVEKNWTGQYTATQEKGIMVYTNGQGEAAWVNNGIVYTIDGQTGLDDEQIRKIANSF
ncbi:MAG: hypothetical protein KIG14_02820 [Candidatus Sacchiramonaceae bacterium]|nr:hypothetical protein [Candidatus Saccharimonadaceae bacterium]